MKLFGHVFAPDNGGGTGSGSSLIDASKIPPESAETPPEGEETLQGDDSQYDAFGDLRDYKDEQGLYFGRYKSIPDAFKGLEELQKELGRIKREKSPEAPETYTPVTLGEDMPETVRGLEIKPDEDPLYQHFAPVFKELALTQEQVEKLVKANIQYSLSQTLDLEAEKKKLGGEAEAIIGDVVHYTQKRNTEGMKVLAELAGQNADALKELHMLVKQGGEKAIPGRIGEGVAPKTWQELRDEAWAYRQQHKDTIDSNPSQQQKYQDLMSAMSKAKKRTASSSRTAS
jgi:hypothetical protein